MDVRDNLCNGRKAFPMASNVVHAALCGTLLLLLSEPLASQEVHSHSASERLGTVAFSTTCKPAVQREFERAVALLHSFAYSSAETSFKDVAATDPNCAIAHWGIIFELRAHRTAA